MKKWMLMRPLFRFVTPTGKRQFQLDEDGLVSARRRGRIPHESSFKTANEAWKAQWNDLLAWSTMFAVAAHAAAFAFWPSWDTIDPWLEPDLELLETATSWIPFYAEPSRGSGGGMAATSLALLEEPDSLPPPGLDAETSVPGAELAVVEFSGGLRERLLGRGGPVPTLVEPGPASAPPDLADEPANTPEEEEREEEEGIDVIVENPTMADLALRLETSTLDLSRLAGLRPQLILPGTSAWFLIRNPAKVEEFMRIVALGQDAEDQGLVDVAVWIDDRGSVEWSEIARSSGSEELDEIALALFNEVASFRPALDEGVRVSMSAIFSVAFPW